jgi:predicted enzyme related to lactoylglutathione lyase
MSQADKANALNWFEIPVTDLDRAARFWETVLGAKLKREKFFGTELAVFESAGVMGALFRDEARPPSPSGTCVYLDARGDLDGCLRRAAEAGGKVVLPRTDIGDPGFIGLVQDSEGNTVGLHTPRAR